MSGTFMAASNHHLPHFVKPSTEDAAMTQAEVPLPVANPPL